jgi:hypothetical protein
MRGFGLTSLSAGTGSTGSFLPMNFSISGSEYT